MPNPTLSQRFSDLLERHQTLSANVDKSSAMNALLLNQHEDYMKLITLEQKELRKELSALAAEIASQNARILAAKEQTDRLWQLAPLLVTGISLFVSTVVGLLVALVRK